MKGYFVIVSATDKPMFERPVGSLASEQKVCVRALAVWLFLVDCFVFECVLTCSSVLTVALWLCVFCFVCFVSLEAG